MVELQSPRLLLRRAREDDLLDLHAILSNEDVMRYGYPVPSPDRLGNTHNLTRSTPPHRKLTETRDWLKGMIEAPRNGVRDFFVEVRSPSQTTPGPMIGHIGCWGGHEIGFNVNKTYWRQGYASEALGLLLEHLWSTTKMTKITADVDPRNEACLRLLKKFGFAETGFAKNTFKTHMGWCDSVYLTLRRRVTSDRRITRLIHKRGIE